MNAIRSLVVTTIIILVIISLLLPYFGFSFVPFENPIKKTKLAPLPKISSYPIQKGNWQQPPSLTARSAIVIDAATGLILMEKNPDIRHLPASTTKLLTALVALEKCPPEKVIRVNQIEKEGTQMGLAIGDFVTVENLLYGLLVASGNDAAQAIVPSCFDSYQQFIVAMNQKAKEIGMPNSHFTNPTGLDDKEQYSTARDLAQLAKVAVANPLIAKIVATQKIIVADYHKTKFYSLENINKLLGEVEGLQGVKTGQTEGSLEILVSKTSRNHHQIIVSLLGSHDRFGESKTLIEWVFNNHQWQNP